MIVLAFIVWLLAHVHPPVQIAAQVWSWECHHVILTILAILVLA